MYALIEPSGCSENHGNVEVRYSFFLEPDDKRYNERYYPVPVTPPTGYPGRIHEGRPLDAEEYEHWLKGLPHIYQLAPFHNHFVSFDPDVSLEQIQAVAKFHQPNFYAAWLQEYDKLPGGMRKGWAVETRGRPIRYDRTDPELHAIRKPQCLDKIALIKGYALNVKSKDIGEAFPATAIDVGSAVINRGTHAAQGYTWVNYNNAANDTGSLDTFELWLANDGINVKVGTFYESPSAPNFTSRDSEFIGAVAKGSKQTFSGKDCEVTAGDWVGIFGDSGAVERDTSGGGGIYDCWDDQFGTGSQTYTLRSGDIISLYATGETPGVTHELAGVIAGVASVSGAVLMTRGLAGLAAGVCGASGLALVAYKLAGIAQGVCSVSGAAAISLKLAGVSAGAASVSGALLKINWLAGVISGKAYVSGQALITRGLAGVASGVCSVTGNLLEIKWLAGFISGAATITGVLSYLLPLITRTLHVRHPALLTVVHRRGQLIIREYHDLSSLDEQYLTKQVGLDVAKGDEIEATTVAGISYRHLV
jgi:hypothetical protein